MDYFERCYYKNLDYDDVVMVTEEMCTNTNKFNINQDLIKTILEITGGHPGLVNDFILELNKHHESEQIIKSIKKKLLNSNLMKSIIKALEEDIKGLVSTSLKFKEAKIPNEFSSPTTQQLVQIGVIHRVGILFELCKGIITETIITFNESRIKQENLGVITTPSIKTLYIDSELEITENDIVFLHISDLHMGENFPFQIPDIRKENDYRHAIENLLYNDILNLNLLGKIDSILISGDITDNGSMSNFNKAKKLLGNLTKLLDIEKNKLIFVAGNHDVLWNPRGGEKKESITDVSREYYESFQEMLGQDASLFKINDIKSKSEKQILRVLSMDSNLIESPLAGGLGFIGPQIFKEAYESLEKHKNTKGNKITNMILTHHHILPSANLLPLEVLKKGKVSVLSNSNELLDFANNKDIKLILYGHNHQPSISMLSNWSNNNYFSNPIITVCAGSLSAKESELIPFGMHHYYIIVIKESEIIIRSRALKRGGNCFFGHSDILIPTI